MPLFRCRMPGTARMSTNEEVDAVRFEEAGELTRALFVRPPRDSDEPVVAGLADVAAVERSRARRSRATPGKNGARAAAMPSTSPSRLGAPGRVRTAPRGARRAASSTNVESG